MRTSGRASRAGSVVPLLESDALPPAVCAMSTGIATADAAVDAAEEVLRFGPFTLSPAPRVLAEGASRVHLGSRAFDILLLLLERAGSFVSRNEIFEKVWPGSVVVEGNLPVHVAALRKAL